MDTDRLFINVLQELDSKVKSMDEFDKIRLSATLRQLLLDSQPLIDIVNRDRKLKIRYVINDYPDELLEPQEGMIVNSAENLLDASLPGLKRIEVSKDKLLSRKVLVVENQIFTVRDLILHIANIQGGVHAGDARKQKEQVLNTLIEVFSIGGFAIGLRMLSIIGQIVRNGLEPLRLVVLGR